MKKEKLILSWIILGMFIGFQPAIVNASSPKTEESLNAIVFENGVVVILDHIKSIATVYPQLFEEGWKMGFDGFGDYRVANGGVAHIALADGTVVPMEVKVDRLPNGLHIYYSFTAPKTAVMSSVRAVVDMPYESWEGAPYRLNDNRGLIPHDAVKGVVIEAQPAPLVLGPSKTQGLVMNLDNQGYTLVLADNRQWSPDLLVCYTHGESGDKSWEWKAGEKKTFDFNLTFNRPVEAFPPQEAKKTKGLEGDWHGSSFKNGLVLGRGSLYLKKEPKGKWLTQISFDNANLINNNAENPTVEVHGKSVNATYTNGMILRLKLNAAGDKLWGTLIMGDADPVTLTRGLDFFIPRLDAQGHAVRDYVYQEPQTMNDGWPVGNLGEAGFDVPTVTQGVDRILDGTFPRFQSLVLLRHGKILMDEYFYGWGPEQAHPLFSVTKSFFSTLFGIAQDQGLVNLHQKLYDLYPDYRKRKDWDSHKDAITLEDVLSMRTGIDCDDMGMSGHERNMSAFDDWVDFCLSLPLNPEWKNHWVYDGTMLHPISAYMVKKSGMSIPDFADKYLFGPLGIQNARWWTGPHNVTKVDAGLWLTPRQMAKLGQLYLQKGMWNGKQIISSQYITAATTPKGQVMGNWWHQYGYLWWLREMNINGRMVKVWEANGYGGQMIWVVPEFDLVCVMTSGNYNLGVMVEMPGQFFKEYILSAVQP